MTVETLSPRLWPTQAPPAAPPSAVALAVAVGLLAAFTLRFQGFGLAVVVVGMAAFCVGLLRATSRQWGWAGAASALLAVGAVRAADWLGAVCLLAATALAALAVVPARTWTGLALSACAPGLVLDRVRPWVAPALRSVCSTDRPVRRAAAVAVLSAVLLLGFGGLFAAADPAYASLVGRLVPDLDPAGLTRRVLVALAVTAGVLVLARLAAGPPDVDAVAPGPGRPVSRWEWVVPLAALDVTFVSFVVVQLAVLFGGRKHVLSTPGLTYADYARSGFWQLLAVTVLTLVVVAVAVRTGPRQTPSDRVVLRVLLGTLCSTALVVVASALQRLALYQQEYGFTRLRLVVDAVELTLGAVFVLLLAAGVRLSASWLPRAVVGVVVAALLSLAALNPDAWIARHNIERYVETGRLDVAYLAGLSADAVPELLRLPAGPRSCVLARLAPALQGRKDPWFDLNVGRRKAWRMLDEQAVSTCPATFSR